MAKSAGNVHIGKAAAIIVAAVLIGGIVLYQNDSARRRPVRRRDRGARRGRPDADDADADRRR